MPKYIWMCVTADEYELPLAVADSAAKLAKILKMNAGTISALESRKCDGRTSGHRIIKVPMIKKARSEGGHG